jgi:hypothetical protein
MSTHALRTAAARTSAADFRSGAPATGRSGRRPPAFSAADALERLSDRLDVLIRDVRLGTTSHRQHERNVDEAEAIGAELRAVFRQSTPPSNPPLAIEGGRAWW